MQRPSRHREQLNPSFGNAIAEVNEVLIGGNPADFFTKVTLSDHMGALTKFGRRLVDFEVSSKWPLEKLNSAVCAVI